MTNEKPCPKCPNQNMTRLSLSVEPVTVKTDLGRINVGVPVTGFPIKAYECPQCGFIELYRNR